MTDSHFSDLRDRSFHSKSSSQHQSDRPLSQFHDRSPNQSHSRFPSRQFQQIVEFGIRFFKFFQSVKNRFFIIEKNFEYINDCLEQYTEENIENQIL